VEAGGLTDAYRWVDRAGYAVDLFGDVAVLSTYADVDEAAIAKQLAGERKLRAIYVKRRPRQEHGADTDAVAPPLPIWGDAVASLVAQEAGMRFEIRPANGLSVGLYVDAAPARAWVRENARGRTVLNLFAYTCGFGVAAMLGGAKRVANLDRSRKVLEWGERNYALNGLAVERRDFIAGDAFEWLKRLKMKGERFDVVVLDPPSFATAERSRFSAAKDYPKLLRETAELGERVVACCNLADAPLERWVRDAGLRAEAKLPGTLPVVVAGNRSP
jgi:23S rRNA (cytosine1962-C5)-methyltransferase